MLGSDEYNGSFKAEALEYFRSKITNIEIVAEEGKETIFFPKLPLCFYLTKYTKLTFEESADRTSSKAKVESIINESDDIILHMEVEHFFKEF